MSAMTSGTDTEVVRAALDAYNRRESDAVSDGIRRWLHDVDERFDDARLEAGEICQVDFKVLTLGQFVLDDVGELDGSREFGLVCEVYDGRILRWNGFASHVEAIRAAEMAEC
jgi:hypothetical protein